MNTTEIRPCLSPGILSALQSNPEQTYPEETFPEEAVYQAIRLPFIRMAHPLFEKNPNHNEITGVKILFKDENGYHAMLFRHERPDECIEALHAAVRLGETTISTEEFIETMLKKFTDEQGFSISVNNLSAVPDKLIDDIDVAIEFANKVRGALDCFTIHPPKDGSIEPVIEPFTTPTLDESIKSAPDALPLIFTSKAALDGVTHNYYVEQMLGNNVREVFRPDHKGDPGARIIDGILVIPLKHFEMRHNKLHELQMYVAVSEKGVVAYSEDYSPIDGLIGDDFQKKAVDYAQLKTPAHVAMYFINNVIDANLKTLATIDRKLTDLTEKLEGGKKISGRTFSKHMEPLRAADEAIKSETRELFNTVSTLSDVSDRFLLGSDKDQFEKTVEQTRSALTRITDQESARVQRFDTLRTTYKESSEEVIEGAREPILKFVLAGGGVIAVAVAAFLPPEIRESAREGILGCAAAGSIFLFRNAFRPRSK